MTDVQTRSREAQHKHLADHPELDKGSQAIYDMVDALSESQKRLLVSTAIRRVHSAIQLLADPTASAADKAGTLFLANGITALAGYTQERLREDLGETSTGDKAIENIFHSFADLAKTALAADLGIPEEKRLLIEKVAERVNERASNGEDINKVIEEEFAKFKEENPDMEGLEVEVVHADGGEHQHVPTKPVVQPTDDSGYGMYL